MLFVSYVRGMVKFSSMDELAAQMRQDDLDIRLLLGTAHAGLTCRHAGLVRPLMLRTTTPP